jgi:HSP20 family molecular chaperone IbpA
MNTINGGASAPRIHTEKTDKAYTVTAQIPGVIGEEVHVDIENNVLQIFHDITCERDNEESFCFPRTVFKQYIPYDVDIDNISAQFQDGTLEVSMPFNDFAGGYHRPINILKL